MATYKVIQDIEAEDKLLGPLSFRQFLYFLIAAFLGFLNFTSLTSGAWPVVLILGPPMFFCLFFAWPWSPDQPTEVWALARIRYVLKPRKRLWNQSGVKDFVTITVPKKIERIYTDGLSQDQVRSRLEALSQTIDTRGWAVKNSFRGSTAIGAAAQAQGTDRLVAYESLPQDVSYADVRDDDDILDAHNNPAAYQMGQMLDASGRAHREAIIEKLRSPAAAVEAAAPGWFQRQQTGAQPTIITPVTPPSTDLPAIPPSDAPWPQITSSAGLPIAQPAAPIAQVPEPPKVATKPTPNAAILNLSHDNNMDVATLAREAARAKSGTLEGEVVVSLH